MENDLIQDTNLDLLQVQVASVEYSGQAPINVDNQQHIISLDQSALSSKLDTSAFNEWTATHTGAQEYSAGDGIDITNHVISVTGQLTGDYLTKASADTLYQPIGDYLTTADSGNFYPMEGNPSGFLTGVDLSNYYQKNETSSKQEIGDVINEINNNITNLSGKYYPLTSNPSGYLTAHQDISDKLDVTAFTAYTATAKGTEYSAGENINITNNVISGKNWSAEIANATTGKLDVTAFNSGDFYPMTGNPSGFLTGVDLSPYQEKSGMTAYQPVGDYYSASNPSGFITGVDLSNYYQKNETSSKEEISAALENAGQHLTPIDPVYIDTANNIGVNEIGLSAGNGILILETADNVLISCTATGGHEYSGIAPIDVNNTTHQISADVWTLSAGNGLSLSEDPLSKVTTISITGAAGRSYGINAEVVANSGMATGQNILYIVTGN